MRDSDLDGLLSAARAAPPMPSTALLRRIEADALDVQALRARPGVAPVPRRAGPLARALAVLGGAQVATGLVAATLVGVAIGLVQPAPLTGLTDRLGGGPDGTAVLDRVELFPALDPFAPDPVAPAPFMAEG